MHTSPFSASSPLIAGLILALFSLACGSFAPRPPADPPAPAAASAPTAPLRTATPSPTATPLPLRMATAGETAPATAPATAPLPAAATPTPTATPPGDLRVGAAARVIARTGVNIRREPTTAAARAGMFPAGALLVVQNGPVYADGYIWWQVDDQFGKAGWVAGGDGVDLWLSGEIGEPRPVNRPVRLGDTVTVSVSPGKSLTVRYEPGERGFVARRVLPGVLLTITEGPVPLDGLRWWRVLRADGLSGWAAEGDEQERWLTPLE